MVTDLDDQTPDQTGIGRHVHDRRAVDEAGQPVAEGLQLRLVERDGSADSDRDPPVPLVPGTDQARESFAH